MNKQYNIALRGRESTKYLHYLAKLILEWINWREINRKISIGGTKVVILFGSYKIRPKLLWIINLYFRQKFKLC